MVNELHCRFKDGMAKSYEFKTRRKKSSEPCWVTDWIRIIIEKKRHAFRTDWHRSDRWKCIKRRNNLEDGFQEDAEQNNQTEAHQETLCRTDDFPTVSTPKRVGASVRPCTSPIPAPQRPTDFKILSRVANVPHWIKKRPP